MSLHAVFPDGRTPAPLHNSYVIKALPAFAPRSRITRCLAHPQPLPPRRPSRANTERQGAVKLLMRRVVQFASTVCAV
jgi:hypothetical protein